MLALPGPRIRIVRKATRYKAGNSPLPKKSLCVTLKKTTLIEMTSGMAASLVNKPRIIKRLQKNSANMVRERDKVLPKPMKFIKCSLYSAKCTILS